jgi:hypothetical protein
MRFELAQRSSSHLLAHAQPSNLPLGLLLLVLQLGGKVASALLRPGGSLSEGRKFDLGLLQLARPGGQRLPVRSLLAWRAYSATACAVRAAS